MKVLPVVGINGQVGGAFSHRVAVKFELVGTMNQAVQDGISEGRIADYVMPFFDRHLTGSEVQRYGIVRQR